MRIYYFYQKGTLGDLKCGHADQVGLFQLNIQCRSGQVSLIGIKYSMAIPIESHLTTQLIAPLLSCKPFFLQLLIMVYVTLFFPFIWSSAVFGEDLQDPCAETEGYAGSLDEAECGVV